MWDVRQRLRTALKILVGLFAALGVAFVGLSLYMSGVDGGCVYNQTSQAKSLSGDHYATFEQTICGDASKSIARVLMGRSTSGEKLLLLEITGTSDVSLTWASE